MNIDEWIAAGWPRRTNEWSSVLNYTCTCDPVREAAANVLARDKWFKRENCYGCKKQYDLTVGSGLGVVEGQGFAGAGVTPTKAPVVPTVPNLPPFSILPYEGTPAPSAVPRDEGRTDMAFDPLLQGVPGITIPGTGGAVTVGVGGVSIGGAPIPGTGISGKSRCPGPYNYNAATGTCVPKSDFAARTGTPGVQPSGLAGTTGCPDGWYWDGTQCAEGGLMGTVHRAVPGGEPGVMAASGWTTTQAFGMAGFVPLAREQTTLLCPKGYVLFGSEPGLEVCLPKGALPNKLRKWPKAPRPALTAGDMKTIRRADSLRNKVKRAAMKSGWSCKKR